MKDKIEIHKARALASMENLIDSYIEKEPTKAKKFLYWIEDYVKFLNYESSFKPQSLRRYKRGEIIKAHLGYNVGSEEGGLHYCVVLDADNNLSSPVLTVVPLTSIKEQKDCSKLKKGEVFLGTDLRDKLNAKLSQLTATIIELLQEIDISAETIEHEDPAKSKFNMLQTRMLLSKLELFEKIKFELDKMKNGSIALVGQITTISKIRIYDPKTDKDPLSKIKLSVENLDSIDNEIRQLYQKPIKNE